MSVFPRNIFLTLDLCVYNVLNPCIDSRLMPLVTGMCKVKRPRGNTLPLWLDPELQDLVLASQCGWLSLLSGDSSRRLCS